MLTIARIRKRFSKVSAELAILIVELAEELGADAYELARLIAFESGGTFDPAKANPYGAVGLIQFTPTTARKLGTSVAELAAMTVREQWRYVRLYFRLVKAGQWAGPPGPLDTKQRLFMAVFQPAAREWPEDRPFNFDAATITANHGIRTPRDYVAFVDRIVKP